jgi:hypothetical protein
MIVRISSTNRVVCRATIQLPMSAGMTWGQLRDFRSSAMHDPFHAKIEIHGGLPVAGARLTILHRQLLWHTTRAGRILRWKEGSGFAFSDLSVRNPAEAFPHVLSYHLEAVDSARCKLHVFVGGRWTAPIWRWLGRLWLWWVFLHVVRTVEVKLLRFALGMKLHGKI